MARQRIPRAWYWCASAIVLALTLTTAAGVAYGRSARVTVTIDACYDTGTGALRIASACGPTESPISWNSEGPPGPVGPPGPAGTSGATNVTVRSEVTNGVGEAWCKRGEKAVGGGYAGVDHEAVSSFPSPSWGTPVGWKVESEASSDLFNVYVICISP